MTTHTTRNYEPGYASVLVRNETKVALRRFRASLKDRDLAQERRIVTAILEMAFDDCQRNPEKAKRVEEAVKNVVLREITTPEN